MTLQRRSLSSLALAAAAAGALGLPGAEAGCPCQNGGGMAMSPAYAPVPMAEPSVPMNYGAMPQPPMQMPTGQPGAGPAYSGATATSWEPPPGTIGRTYQMKSRPVPVKMHPRAAVVDVRIPNATDVRVHDMNVYRTQDFLEGFQDADDPAMWHFTSEPLIPGLSHIYRIEAKIAGPDGEQMQERYVRLIMGRVIEVQF